MAERRRIAVIGAGWTGASAARALHDAGFAVDVHEKSGVVGGHSRSEVQNGLVFEPNGPHIFHTNDAGVARFVHRFGLARPYAACIKTEVLLDDEPRLMSWPMQMEEIRRLPCWPRIRRELDDRPSRPWEDNFESYCISIVGETLYRLFIYDYTVKQWATDPVSLASHFAPKRIELRTDGDRRLFRDTWQYFPAAGVNDIIETVLSPLSVCLNSEILLTHIVDEFSGKYDGLVCTAPLDLFCQAERPLAWRGIRSHAIFHATADPAGKITAAYVINRPHARVGYTRTVETKHASGQRVPGSIVCEEYPNGTDRHYPVLTADGVNLNNNQALKDHIKRVSPLPVWFCGRLANYEYINQDQAVRQGLDTAAEIIAHFHGAAPGRNRTVSIRSFSGAG